VSCTDRPIPFADYLNKSNREHGDSFEMSRACRERCDAEPVRQEDDDRRAVTKPDEMRTESVRRVEFTYEIQSNLPTGRLIDVLL